MFGNREITCLMNVMKSQGEDEMEDKKIFNIFSKEIAIATLVAIVGPYFIQPLISYIWEAVFYVSSSFWKTYNDGLYIRIAQNENRIDITSLIYLIFILALLFFYAFMYLTTLMDSVLAKTDSITDEIEGKPEKRPLEVIRQELLIVRRKQGKKFRIYKACFLVCIGLFLILNIFTVATETVIKQKVNQFENVEKIIAPYVSDLEIKTLDSQFHLMHNKEDFDRLNKNLQDIVKLHIVPSTEKSIK